jgi:ATP phosphoribosyltransferase
VEVVEHSVLEIADFSWLFPKMKNIRVFPIFRGKNRNELSEILFNYFAEKALTLKSKKSRKRRIATGIGLADGIFDIVSTGSTLIMNGLKEVDAIVKKRSGTDC